MWPTCWPDACTWQTGRCAWSGCPSPEPGHGQVRIRVATAGVCLSDVHLVDGTLSPVFLQGGVVTLGHEVAGTVDALGAGVPGWSLRQRVLLQARAAGCGWC